jgi:hypothetical protein
MVYVLDAFGTNARVFAAGRKGTAELLHGGEKNRKKRQVSIKLLLRYPEVSTAAIHAAVEKIGAGAAGIQSVHITIDAGPSSPNWFRLEKFVTAIISNIRSKSPTPIAVLIDGAFTRPGRHHIDWLTRQRITIRYVLGPALGYACNIDGRTTKTLKAMSDEGLRVLVLFYWSGQRAAAVKNVLKRALLLNKFAGVGILPCFLSPRFDRRTTHNLSDSQDFSQVVSRLYADRMLCEHLEEPISDIEHRLAGSSAALCVHGLITEQGDLLSFRHFPFAAKNRLNGNSHYAARPGASAKQLNAPMCSRCRRCAWRHICGGIDTSPHRLTLQYKIAADSWCQHRKALMHRVIGECLEIREQLHQVKNLLPKDATK